MFFKILSTTILLSTLALSSQAQSISVIQDKSALHSNAKIKDLQNTLNSVISTVNDLNTKLTTTKNELNTIKNCLSNGQLYDEATKACTPLASGGNPTCSLGTTGYCTWPNGYTEQWGRVTSCSNASSGCLVNFPQTFSNLYSVVITVESPPNSPDDEYISSKTNSSFRIDHGGGTKTQIFNWRAVGKIN